MLNRDQVEADISGLYVTTIGRAPDSAGVAYWVDQVMTGNMDVSGVAQSFFDQPEVKTKYDGLDTHAFVEATYQNVLGRAADTDGLNYWVGQLDSDAFSKNQFIEAVNNGATGDDAARLSNLKDTAFYYMNKVGTDTDLASSVLDSITSNVSTKADAFATIDYYNANKDHLPNTDAASVAQWKQNSDFSTCEDKYSDLSHIDNYSVSNLLNDPDIQAESQAMFTQYGTPETYTPPLPEVSAAFEFKTDGQIEAIALAWTNNLDRAKSDDYNSDTTTQSSYDYFVTNADNVDTYMNNIDSSLNSYETTVAQMDTTTLM